MDTLLLDQKIQFLEQKKDEATRRAERAEEKEARLLSQIDKLTDTLKLLEAPKAETVQTRPPEPTYTTPRNQSETTSGKKAAHGRKKGF